MPFTSLRLRGARPLSLPRGYPLAPVTLGEHLCRRRLDLGLTQRTLAGRLGVREESVHQWERGRATPRPRSYGRLVGFLGYDPAPGDGTLASRLRVGRRRSGMSQAALAARLGLDEGTVSDLERGRRRLSRKARESIERFLARDGPSGAGGPTG